MRMLCSRSASLMTSTRMSRAIATTILRTVSACGRLAVLDLVELGDAVDEVGDLVAEVGAQLRRACSRCPRRCRAAARRTASAASCPARRGSCATASGWVMYGSPLLRSWPRWCALGDRVGPLDLAQVGLRVGRADDAEQRLEHRVGVAALRAEPGEPGAHRREPGAAGAADAGPAPAATVGGSGADRSARRRAGGASRRRRVRPPRRRARAHRCRLGRRRPGSATRRRALAAPRCERASLRVTSVLRRIAGRARSDRAAGRARASLRRAASRPSRKPSSSRTDDPDHLGRRRGGPARRSPRPCRRWPARRRRRAPGRPARTRPAWTSIVASPYSSAYDCRVTSRRAACPACAPARSRRRAARATGAAEDEPARLDAGDLVDGARPDGRRDERVDDRREARRGRRAAA